MKTIKTIISFLFFVSSFHTSYSQYESVQINLEIISPLKMNHCIRISLYQNDSSSFLVGIKNNCIFDINKNTTWYKRDADTIYSIPKSKFNEIVEMYVNLPTSLILKGMNPSNPSIWSDGTGVNIEIVIMQQSISYSVFNPKLNTKERNLEPFLSICEKLLLLAKVNPKEIF